MYEKITSIFVCRYVGFQLFQRKTAICNGTFAGKYA